MKLRDGIAKYTCSKCGETKTETIPAAGHTWPTEYTVDVEPTCTESGLQSIRCEICGEVREGTEMTIDPLGHALVAGLAVDTTLSARAAFDLRDTLERLSAENEDIRRLLRRAEIAQTFAEDDLRRFRARMNGSREAWEARAKALRGSGAQRAAAMLESYRAMNRELLDTLETIADSVSGALPHPAQLAPDDHSFVSELRRARMAAKQGVALRAEAYSGMLRQLRGNPGAVSRMAEAMKLLKTMERESRAQKPPETE